MRSFSAAWVLLGGCWSGRHVETSLVERELGREQVREVIGVALSARLGRDGVTLLSREHASEATLARVEIQEWQERTVKLVIGRRRRLLGTHAEQREVERTPIVGEIVPWTGGLGVHVAESTSGWRDEATVQVVDGRITDTGGIPVVPLHHETASVRLDAGVPLVETDEPALYRAFTGLALADPSIGEATRLRRTWVHWYTPQPVRIALDALVLPELTSDPFKFREPEPFVRLSVGDDVIGCTRVVGDDLHAGTYDLGVAYVGDVRRADRLTIDVLDADLKSHDLLSSWSGIGIPASGAGGWVTIAVGEADARPSSGLGSCRKGLDQIVDAVGVARDVVTGARELLSCLERDIGRSPLGTLIFHLDPAAGDDLEPILEWLDAQRWLIGVIPLTEENRRAHEILEVLNPNANLSSLGLCLAETVR